jgi:hypothetical protein
MSVIQKQRGFQAEGFVQATAKEMHPNTLQMLTINI